MRYLPGGATMLKRDNERGKIRTEASHGRQKSVSTPGEPWDVSDAGYPGGGNAGQKLRFLVRYSIHAPYRHNTQPWLNATLRKVGLCQRLQTWRSTEMHALAAERRAGCVLDQQRRVLL